MPDEDIGQNQDSWDVDEYNKIVSWDREQEEETEEKPILETDSELTEDEIEKRQGPEGFHQDTDPQEQYFDENLDDEQASETEVLELEQSMLLEKAINAGVAGIPDFAPIAALSLERMKSDPVFKQNVFYSRDPGQVAKRLFSLGQDILKRLHERHMQQAREQEKRDTANALLNQVEGPATQSVRGASKNAPLRKDTSEMSHEEYGEYRSRLTQHQINKMIGIE